MYNMLQAYRVIQAFYEMPRKCQSYHEMPDCSAYPKAFHEVTTIFQAIHEVPAET